MPVLVGREKTLDTVTFGIPSRRQMAELRIGLSDYVLPASATAHPHITDLPLFFVPYQLESLMGLGIARKLGLLEQHGLAPDILRTDFDNVCTEWIEYYYGSAGRPPRKGHETADCTKGLAKSLVVRLDNIRLQEHREIGRLRPTGLIGRTRVIFNALFHVTTSIPDNYICFGERHCRTLSSKVEFYVPNFSTPSNPYKTPHSAVHLAKLDYCDGEVDPGTLGPAMPAPPLAAPLPVGA